MSKAMGLLLVEKLLALDMKVKPLAAQFLHMHGRVMGDLSPLSGAKQLMGAPKNCYQNSALIALGLSASRAVPTGGLYYCEGYACSASLDFPIEHAWLCDADGRVIETTWKEAGSEYFGVAFNADFLSDFLAKTGYYGVLCSLYMLRMSQAQALDYLGSGVLDFEALGDTFGVVSESL